MTMRVEFCGAGGTGKTTIAEAFVKKFDCKKLGSVAREVQKEFGLACEDGQKLLSPERLWELQQAITTRHNELIQMTRDEDVPYVSDRSMLDHVGYTVLKNRSIALDQLEWMENLALESLKGVSLLIHFPTRVFPQPEPDGFRTANVMERECFDAIVRGYLHRWRGQFNFMSLPVEGSDKRMRHITAMLTRLAADATVMDLIKEPEEEKPSVH